MSDRTNQAEPEKAEALLIQIYDERKEFLGFLTKSSPVRLHELVEDMMHDACILFLKKAKRNQIPLNEEEAKYLFVRILEGIVWNNIKRKYASVNIDLLGELEHEDDIFRFMAKGLGREKELLAACHEAREALEGEIADVMKLRFQDDYSIQDISDSLSISMATVKRRIKEGKKRIRATLVSWKLIQAIFGFGGIFAGIFKMNDSKLESALHAAYKEFPVGMPPSDAAIEAVESASAKASKDGETAEDVDPELYRGGDKPSPSLKLPTSSLGGAKVLSITAGSLALVALGYGLFTLNTEPKTAANRPRELANIPAKLLPEKRVRKWKVVYPNKFERFIAQKNLKCRPRKFKIRVYNTIEIGCFFELDNVYYMKKFATVIPKSAVLKEIK